MSLAALNNPFRKQQVGHERTPPPGNVPGLHKHAQDCLRRLVRETQTSDTGASLLVRGEAGSGKSHFITQVRNDLADNPGVVLVRVPLQKAYVGQIWRFVRARVAEELLSRGWNTNEPSLTGLVRIMKNRFPNWSPDQPRGSLIEMLTGASLSPGQVIQRELNENADGLELSYELRQVLPKLWDKDASLATVAASWLKGTTLGEDDLRRLGLPTSYPNDYEREQQARDAVFSLLRLAGTRTTFIVCFDEVEAILTSADDAVALRAFTNLVTDLVAEPGPRLVVTFIRPTTTMSLIRHVENSNIQKMGQVELDLPFLERWEDVVQIVTARLHADHECRAERIKHPDQLWPFGEAFVRGLYEREHLALTPRHLLKACMVEFERLRRPEPKPLEVTPTPPIKKEPEVSTTKPEPTPAAERPAGRNPSTTDNSKKPPEVHESVPDKEFARLWEKRRQHHATHTGAIDFEVVMGNGLRWLATLATTPLEANPAIDSKLLDINIVFRPAGTLTPRTGISFCHHDARFLWHRLNRLINQAQAAKAYGLLERLVLLRPADFTTTPVAQQRLDKLRRGGAVVLLVQPQQLVELAAFQELLSMAQTGVVTDAGRPITGSEFTVWARSNLSSAVKELAVDVFGPKEAPAATPTVPRPAVKRTTTVN